MRVNVDIDVDELLSELSNDIILEEFEARDLSDQISDDTIASEFESRSLLRTLNDDRILEEFEARDLVSPREITESQLELLNEIKDILFGSNVRKYLTVLGITKEQDLSDLIDKLRG